MIEVWTGDAEELIARLPVDIDLLVTDPPYGKEALSRRAVNPESMVGDGDQTKIDRILRAVFAKLRPHRHAYVFGPQRDLPAAVCQLIWDKRYPTGGNLADVWSTQHEPIHLYVHRYPSEPTGGSQVLRLRRGTVISVPAIRGRVPRSHPYEKPVELWRHLIEASSLPGDLVVDPFLGSGSSALAAVLCGRRFIGIELEARYADRATARVARLQKALDYPW